MPCTICGSDNNLEPKGIYHLCRLCQRDYDDTKQHREGYTVTIERLKAIYERDQGVRDE